MKGSSRLASSEGLNGTDTGDCGVQRWVAGEDRWRRRGRRRHSGRPRSGQRRAVDDRRRHGRRGGGEERPEVARISVGRGRRRLSAVLGEVADGRIRRCRRCWGKRLAGGGGDAGGGGADTEKGPDRTGGSGRKWVQRGVGRRREGEAVGARRRRHGEPRSDRIWSDRRRGGAVGRGRAVWWRVLEKKECCGVLGFKGSQKQGREVAVGFEERRERGERERKKYAVGFCLVFGKNKDNG